MSTEEESDSYRNVMKLSNSVTGNYICIWKYDVWIIWWSIVYIYKQHETETKEKKKLLACERAKVFTRN